MKIRFVQHIMVTGMLTAGILMFVSLARAQPPAPIPYATGLVIIWNNPSPQEASFAPVSARYFRFTALQEINNAGWASAAEFSVSPAKE